MSNTRPARNGGLVAPYLFAAGLVAAAAIVHFVVDPYIHPSSPYALFYLAILGSAWFFGGGPAIAAAVLSAGVVEALLVGPENWTPLRMLPFVFASAGIITIARLAHTIHSRESRLNARLAAILNSTEDVVVSKDLNGIIQDCNPACERLFGYTAAELIGRPVTILIPPELQDEEAKILERMRRGERIEHFETVRVTKDGRRLNVSLTISPIRDHRGHIIGVSKIARDITAAKLAASGLQDERAAVAQDRERLLEAERVARTEAERASRVKDDFVAVVSHELRTPLNAILGWTEVLLRTQKDPQTIRGLEIIRRNTQLQAQLISDLLDISRVVSGKLQLALETLDLVPVIDRAIEMVQHAAEARGIAVVRHFAIKTAIAVGDPHRLQQVVANLLSNAIKFTPPSGRIEVELRRAGTRFEIVVSDNGIGIQPEMLERVFERFHQQDAPTTRRQSGLGLGLAIVRNLVELHGGKVWATSDGADRGATFIVALPVAAGDAVQAQPAARASASASALDSRSLKDLRVLVVEDEVDNRDVIRRLLEAHGASVFTAGTAAEAVLQASDHRPHILVSDIGLPDVDGYELIRRIRALESDGLESIPAVALTAFARSEDRTRALRAGYQAHIAKPVEPAELIATLASFAGLLPGERH